MILEGLVSKLCSMALKTQKKNVKKMFCLTKVKQITTAKLIYTKYKHLQKWSSALTSFAVRYK